MDDKTGMDRLAGNDCFFKEDKGGIYWFFITGPTLNSVNGCDTLQCVSLFPQSPFWSVYRLTDTFGVSLL